MICKNCGTQFTGAYCSHCGHKGESDVYQPTAVAPPEVTVKPVTEIGTKGKKRSAKARGSRRPIHLKMVLWQAIAMLLPLAYFFIDLFVQLQTNLGEVAAKGQTNLSLLFSYLSSPEYSDNTVSDIVTALFGEGAIFERISVRALFGGAPQFVVPVLVTLVLALLSATMAVLLLITGGRILHVRVATELCLVGGVGATFAPLLSSFFLRLGFCFGEGAAAADAAMLCITPSVQSLLLMVLLVLILLPATHSIAKLAAYLTREEPYVPLPFRLIKRCSFTLVRALAGAAIACSLVLVILYLFVPVTSEGDLLAFSGAWKSFSADLTALCKSIWDIISGAAKTPDFAALASMLLKFFFFLQIPFLAAGFVAVAATLIRIWRMRADTLCDRKNDRARLSKIGKRIRHIVLRPYVTFVTLQVILFFLLLFLSPVATHLDFADIDGTLSVIYLTLAEVKAFCGTTTVYAFLALGGALLWHVADKFSKLLIVKADEK